MLNEIIPNNKDHNSDAVSGITNTAECLGVLIGPLIGGLFNDLFGF